MHGAGNDFVILDLRTMAAPSPEFCRALANRHTGIGCDLILGINTPRSKDSVASYEIWTSAGSISMQCVNGARCIAAWLIRAGLTNASQFAIDSPSGTHNVEVLNDQTYRITLGIPQFSPRDIPLSEFNREQENHETQLENGLKLRFSAVSMGNPHAVIEVDNVDTAPVNSLGSAVQASTLFLPTVNVGFVEVLSRDRIKLRVFEYGVGETLACGSGACAAAAVLMRQDRIDRKVSVLSPGGELQVHWPSASAPITLTGPVVFIFEGFFFYATV